MDHQIEKGEVRAKDGWVKREADTGRFIAVGTSNGIRKPTEKSKSAVAKASAKRSAALKRLADR